MGFRDDHLHFRFILLFQWVFSVPFVVLWKFSVMDIVFARFSNTMFIINDIRLIYKKKPNV
jgi:hypothetical protein